MDKPSLESIYGKKPDLEEIYKPKEKKDILSGGLKLGFNELNTGIGEIPMSAARGMLDIPLGYQHLSQLLRKPQERQYIENPLPEATTALGQITELGTSLFGPSGIAKLAKSLKPVAAIGGEWATGIPREIIMHKFSKAGGQLRGKFDQKEEYAKLGEQLREAYEKKLAEFGSDVGKAKMEALTGETSKLPLGQEPLKQIQFVEKPYLGTSPEKTGLMPQESELIQKVKTYLSPEVKKTTSPLVSELGKPITKETVKQSTIEDLANAQRLVREHIGSWGQGTGNELMKKVDTILTDELRRRVPNYEKAMSKYSDFMDYQSMVGKGALKPENIESTIRNLGAKTLEKQGAFKELTGLEEEPIKDILTKQMFSQWMPQRGYTTGGEAGVGNIFRAQAPKFMWPAFSPKIAGATIEALPSLGKIMKYSGVAPTIEELMRKRGQ